MPTIDQPAVPTQERWLSSYHLYRAAFSILWVLCTLTLGQQNPLLGAVLLVLYPLWDAGANYLDASRSGGLSHNRTQALNLAISLVTAIAVLAALQMGLNAVLTVFGAWAVLSGLLQLATAIRRWRSAGAQWAMILSGAQSALAGAVFIVQAQQPVAAVLPLLAGYAGFGALYFLISGVWLLLRQRRNARA